jgi:flagellar biosynthesis/type III secretory pathway protein FliH
MKTVFTESELKEFVRKKIAEIEGSNILLAARKEDYQLELTEEEKGDIMKIASKAADKFLNLGHEAGYIQGQLAFLKEFNNLIEI